LRIRARLVVWAGLAVVPLVLAGLIDLWGTWTDTRRQVNASMEHQVELAALALEHWIDVQGQPLITAADYISEHPGGASTFHHSLSFLSNSRQHWVDLRIVNDLGETTFTQPSEAGLMPPGLADRLLTRARTTSLAVETDWSQGEGRYHLAIATSIKGGGAVIGRIDQAAIADFFRQISLPEQRLITLLDPQRRLVYRSNNPATYGGTEKSSSILFQTLTGRRGAAVAEETSAIDGVDRVYGAARVGATGFVLAVGVPTKTLYIPARRQLFIHSLLSALTLGCTILAALFIARGIGEPLGRLITAVRRFGKGDVSARASIDGGDEIAELGATFNKMAESTEERETRLRELDHLKSEFVSSVSHELRTPLTTIKMLTRLMLRGGISAAEQRESLEHISSECDRQIDLVLNLLDLTRIESGGFSFSLSRTDPVEIVRACLNSQRHTARLNGHELCEDLPAVLPDVRTDPKVLRRVLSTLIENANKFTGSGGCITLGARATGDEVSFYLADTGVGIMPADMPHVFEKFYRGNSSAVGASNGSSDHAAAAGVGLGLYLAKNLIEQLGGRISVTSEVGHGSTFTVHMPVWRDGIDSEGLSECALARGTCVSIGPEIG